MAKKSKGKVLFMTDSPNQPTGYGNVLRNVISGLTKEGWECHAIGLQSSGAPTECYAITGDSNSKYVLHPRGAEPEGADIVSYYLGSLNPDFFITLRDIGLQAASIRGVKEAKVKGWSGKWLAYIPYDTDSISFDWKAILSEPDGLIAMSAWGKTMLKERLGLDSVLIPHGVDLDVFKPLDRAIVPLRKVSSPISDMFVVGAVGRNQSRKRWDMLFRAWQLFAKDKTDVVLLLHTDAKPPQSHDGWDMESMMKKYGVEGSVMLTSNNLNIATRFWISDSQVNEIYNAMDVFCFPTGGEGFGIPLLEAQAAGKPVITTAFTTGFELVEGHGRLIPILEDNNGRRVVFEGQNGVEFVYADYVKMAEHLDFYYTHRDVLLHDGTESLEFSKQYAWPVICKVWDDVLSNLLNG